MKKKTVLASLLICLLAMLSFTGCDRKQGGVETTEDNSVPSYTTESVQIFQYSVDPIVFNGSSKMPVLQAGSLVGYLKLNQVDKVMINDVYNKAATAKGIDYSYSMNFSLSLEDYKGELITVKCTPSIVSRTGEVLGAKANVGWTGFPETVTLVNDFSKSHRFEVGLQPQVRNLPKGSKIKLSLSSLDGSIQFDDIYLNKKVLSKARTSGSLKTIDDTTVINSINGAQFSINFGKTYLEKNAVASDNINSLNRKFYEFSYTVNYLRGPTNNTYVNSFDSFDSNKMVAPLVVALQTDSDEQLLYDENPDALHYLYSNSNNLYYYVTDWSKPLAVGKKKKVVSNREITDYDLEYTPKYVRFRVEFPEEADARTDKELLNFDGRFTVYQIAVSQRTLKEEPR